MVVSPRFCLSETLFSWIILEPCGSTSTSSTAQASYVWLAANEAMEENMKTTLYSVPEDKQGRLEESRSSLILIRGKPEESLCAQGPCSAASDVFYVSFLSIAQS